MKYSPKVNDRLAGCPKVADMHPLQPDGTAQGILEIVWRLGELFKEISGLDYFSIQPGGGARHPRHGVGGARLLGSQGRKRPRHRRHHVLLAPRRRGLPDRQGLQSRRAASRRRGAARHRSFQGDAEKQQGRRHLHDQSRRHRHLQPPHPRVHAAGSRSRRDLLLRPGQRQRPAGHHPHR